jgi:hypothetical protein
MINNLPDVRLVDDVKIFDDLTCSSIIYINRGEGENFKNISFNFNIIKQEIITPDSATKL